MNGFDENGVRFDVRLGEPILLRQLPTGHVVSIPAALDDEPVFRLPPVIVDQASVSLPLAETIDWGVKLFGIPDLWLKSTGKNCRVAILDTGVDDTHPDLQGAIKDVADFTRSQSGYVDSHGHGTHCAGVVAARHNDAGVVGVAPEAELYCGKVLGDNGSGTSTMIADGIRWAMDKGCHVISMSLGSSQPTPESYEMIKAATKAGIVIVAAAGNEGPRANTVGYPAMYPEVVAVGAIDQQKRITSFSSRGPAVDICAPGNQILSTVPNRDYAVMSGTSMATPFVAGVIALMWERNNQFASNGQLTLAATVLQHLKATAVDAGDAGFDPNYGNGLINPAWLLALMNPNVVVPIVLTSASFTEAGLKALLMRLKAGQQYLGYFPIGAAGEKVPVVIDLTQAPESGVPVVTLPPGFVNPFA